MDMTLASGAGSIVSNGLDYSKWIKVMIDSSGPISAAGHRALKTSRSLLPGSAPYTGPYRILLDGKPVFIMVINFFSITVVMKLSVQTL